MRSQFSSMLSRLGIRSTCSEWDFDQMRSNTVTVVVAALVAVITTAAHAQGSFPTRPITMVVPLPAGGTADLLCRLAADKASTALGQQVVIENRPGGAG